MVPVSGFRTFRSVAALFAVATLLIATLITGCVGEKKSTITDVQLKASDLGPGWRLTSEIEGGAELAPKGSTLEELFTGFGARKVLNQFFNRNGVDLQVNLILFDSADDAKQAVEFLAKNGRNNVYGTRNNIGVEIISADQASRELAAGLVGIEVKPGGKEPLGQKRGYDVSFQLACVDNIDYMRSNELANYLQGYQEGQPVDPGMQAIISTTTFGNSLALFVESGDNFSAEYSFDPGSTGKKQQDDSTIYSFDAKTLPRESGAPYVTVTGKLSVGSSDLEHGDGSVLASEEKSRYVAGSSFWPTSNPQVQKLAGDITGSRSDDEKKAEALRRWVRENIEYKGPVGTRYGTMQVLDQRYGRCWDSSDVFVTLARASGIPARQVGGWLVAASAGHVWSQVYLDGKGWVGVDCTSDRVGTSSGYLPFFATLDGAMPILYVKMPVVEEK